MKKILIIMLLLTSPCFGIKKLKPGDVVKGRKIQETYYAYSEEEQAQVMYKLRTASATQLLLQNKEREIELLKQEISLLKSYNIKYNSVIASYTIITNNSFEREKHYTDITRKLITKVKRANRKGRRSFLAGILTTIGAISYLKR